MAIETERRMPEAKVVYRASAEETVELGRPWMCLQFHLIGYVRRVNGIRRLHLGEGHIIIGQAEIRCPVCGRVRTWPWDQEAKK